MKAEESKHPCKNNTFPQCSKKISKTQKIYRQKKLSKTNKNLKKTQNRMRKDY